MLDCSTRSLNPLLPKAESMWSCSCPSELVWGKFSRELSLASPSILFFDLSTLLSFSISFIFSHLFFTFPCLLSVSSYSFNLPYFLHFPCPVQLYSLSPLSFFPSLFLAIPPYYSGLHTPTPTLFSLLCCCSWQLIFVRQVSQNWS